MQRAKGGGCRRLAWSKPFVLAPRLLVWMEASLSMLRITEEHMCRVGREDDGGQESLAGEFCHIHIVQWKDPTRHPACSPGTAGKGLCQE